MSSLSTNSFKALFNHLEPNATLINVWPLTGGMSAQMVALEFKNSNNLMQKWVVRMPASETIYQLLRTLNSTSIPTPTPIVFDSSCKFFPEPLMVLEYLEGEIIFAPQNINEYMTQFAQQLAKIHRFSPENTNLAFPKMDNPRGCAEQLRQNHTTLDHLFDVAKMKAFVSKYNPKLSNLPVLLHGDFWPGNTLWQDDKLVAVIDWEDAHFGEPLSDLAQSRSEISWIFGSEAVNHFTAVYQQSIDIDYADLPYWDLCAALRFVRFIDGDLSWIPDFFGEHGRTDLTPSKITNRVQKYIYQAFEKLE